MIYTRLSEKPKTIPAPTGNGTEKTYHYIINHEGKKELVEDSYEDVYEIIQASLEGVKIENIIRRYTQGDPTALEAVRGSYLDATAMPTNLMDLNNLLLNAQADFNKLPLEIRKQFDFSLDKYVNTMGGEEWKKIMGMNEKESEVKTDEPRNDEQI